MPASNAHNRGYLGTLILQIPASAATTYTVGFVDDQNFTFFNNDVGLLIPHPLLNPNQTGLVLIPAQIQVAIGSCCIDIGTDVECLDDVTSAQCSAAAATNSHFFRLGQPCAQNGGPICPQCVDLEHCFDPLPGQVGDDNLCTSQTCVNAVCVYADVFNSLTQCCDPETGSIAAIDDGDVCTADNCNSFTGEVAHDPITTGPDSDSDGVVDCDEVCPGVDDLLFAPGCSGAIPTVSTWGLLVLPLALLSVAKVNSIRHGDFGAAG